MRSWAVALALGAALLVPIASAEDAEEEGAGDAPAEAEEASGDAAVEEKEEEPGNLELYAESMRTRALTGLNGLLTAPADPVMAAVKPPKALEKAGYGQRPLGLASGILLMLYRSFSGLVDLGLAPVPALPVVSPVPRYKLIPGFEHADE